ncbi:MAG TPA: cupredoxin domain-containing protein [archaeon]|nr:cupredoxin domain-containing protein [archaeon]
MRNLQEFGILALIGLAVVVSGCAQAQTHTVGIEDGGLLGSDDFNPASVTIRQGDSVRWTNMDNEPHTVTSDSGNELASNSLARGETYTHAFLQKGTYTYHCAIHPEMRGTVIVQ